MNHMFQMPDNSPSKLSPAYFKKRNFENEIVDQFIKLFEYAKITDKKINIREMINFDRLYKIKNDPANKSYNSQKTVGSMIASNELLDILFKIDDKKYKINNKQCSISFDKNFDISTINLHLRFGPHNSYSFSSNLYIYFDKYFKPFKLTFENRDKDLTIEKTENIIDLENELFLMKYMYVLDDSLVNEIFPEIKIVSAYNYNSEEFKRKIEYCELLEY